MRRRLLGSLLGASVLAIVWASPAAADHCPVEESSHGIGYPDRWDDWDTDGDCAVSGDDEVDLADGEAFAEELKEWAGAQLEDNGGEYTSRQMRDWFREHTDLGFYGAILRKQAGIADQGNWGGDRVDDARGTAGDAVDRVAPDVPTPASLASAAFESIANSVGEAAGSVTGWVAGELADTGTPSQLSADWYQEHYQRMLGWSGLIMVPLAMVAIGSAVLRGETAKIGEVLLQVPAAYLMGVVAIGLVAAAGGLAQTMAETLAGDITDSSEALASNVSGLLTVQSRGMGPGLVLLLGLVIAIAALVTAVWLILSEAAIYGVVLFVPLAFSGRVWPDSPAAAWGRKLLSFAFALVAVKVVIFAMWALSVDGLAAATDAVSFSGGASDSDETVPLRSAIATAALLMMTAFSPAAVLRMIPMTEGGAGGAAAGGAAARNVKAGVEGAVKVADKAGIGGGGRSGGGGGSGGGGQLKVSNGGGGGQAGAPSSPGGGQGGDTPAPAPAPASKPERGDSGGGDGPGTGGRPSGPGGGEPPTSGGSGAGSGAGGSSREPLDGGTRNRGKPGPSDPSPQHGPPSSPSSPPPRPPAPPPPGRSSNPPGREGS